MELTWIASKSVYRTVLLETHSLVRLIYASRYGLIGPVSQWLFDHTTDERTSTWPGYTVLHEDHSVTIEFSDAKLATAFKMTWG